MNPPRIIISVFAGLVQDVYCSIPDAQVILVDWDQDPDPPFALEELVHGANHCSALAGSFGARPTDDLVGSDEEAAIQEAQELGVLAESVFVVS